MCTCSDGLVYKLATRLYTEYQKKRRMNTIYQHGRLHTRCFENHSSRIPSPYRIFRHSHDLEWCILPENDTCKSLVVELCRRFKITTFFFAIQYSYFPQMIFEIKMTSKPRFWNFTNFNRLYLATWFYLTWTNMSLRHFVKRIWYVLSRHIYIFTCLHVQSSNGPNYKLVPIIMVPIINIICPIMSSA